MGQSWTKAHDASKNSYWKNLPSTETPIVKDELNRNELSVDTIDDRVITLDTTKAEQSDFLGAFTAVSFNSSTGTFTFTKANATTVVIDTDIEKIAVNFDYDDDPTSAHYQQLVIQLDDGTYKYVDLSALITEYEFADTSTIHFSVSNDGEISANVIDGSITEAKLQPNFLADCRAAKSGAELAEAGSEAQALISEGWAVGTQNGSDVPISSPYFRNNAKWYKDQAQSIAGAGLGGLSDVVLTNPQNGQVLTYDASFDDWENRDPQVTRVQSLDLIEKDTVFNADGSITVTADDYTENVVFGEGYITDSFTFTDGTTVTKYITFNADGSISERLGFSASVTVSFLDGTTVTLSKGSTTLTATTNPYTFTVTDSGVWTLNATRGNYQYTENINITPASSVITKEIMLPEGKTVTPTDDVATLIYCAGINNSSITTIAGLLADSTTLTAVINSNNAIDYLARSISFAEDFCDNSSAMTLIGNNNYAANSLLSVYWWNSKICGSRYKESVLNLKIPVMTSNTTPSGIASASNESSASAYKAFDNNSNTSWYVSNTTNAYIDYQFAENVRIYRAEITPAVQSGLSAMFTWQYIDNNTRHNIITQRSYGYGELLLGNPDNINCNKWGVSISADVAGNYGIVEAQFYGRVDV